MSSPFPGMDPYLESAGVWPAFHHQLVASIYQTLLPGLVDRYRARVGSRCYASETPLFTSVLREDHSEDFLEIRSRADGRMVTLVEVVCPANKTTPAGREAYLNARAHAARQKAAIVEIDLLTQGTPTLDYNRDGLPEHHYTVTVTRGGTPERYEIYTATVKKRLPKFKLPLGADDRDTVLDLQTAVVRAFDQGDFADQIDYSDPLPSDVAFDQVARDWVAAWLEQQNER